MSTKQVLLISLATLFIPLNTFAAEKPQVKTLLSDSLNIYNELEQIKAQKKESLEDLNEKLKTCRLKIKLLKEPVFNEERIRHYKDNIALAQNQIEVHRAAIEFAKITDPAERAKMAKKYDDQREKLLEDELLAAKQFSRQIDELEKETKDKQEIFTETMKKFFNWPKESYPAIVRTEVNAKYHAGTVTYEWWDAENNHQAFCNAQIKLTDTLPHKSNIKMLDDTYAITRLWSQTIEVQIGRCKVRLTMRDSQLWGEEKMRGFIKEFIDLDGLAQINAADGKNQTEDLIRTSLAYSKKYRKIINEKSDIVKPLTDERVKTKNLIRILKDPPLDDEQIVKEKEKIDYWNKELQNYKTRLEMGTLDDPTERTTLLEALQADKKTLDTQKRSTGKPYDDKMKALIRGLKEKDSLLNDALKGYIKAKPDGFKDISEMTTKASFSEAEVSCLWKGKKGDVICTAIFFLRNQPSVPDNAKMLANHYYVDMGGGINDFIWLWTGNIHVYFDVKNKDRLKTEKIDQIVNKFIDLAGLEKVSAM